MSSPSRSAATKSCAEKFEDTSVVAVHAPVVDLCSMLEQMGAAVDGAGSSTITVEGVSSLQPVSYTTVPDRIVAGTWAIGAVMTQGDVAIHNARPEHLEIVLDRLVGCGAAISALGDGFHVEMNGRPSAVDVVTLPYPGFPTDFLPMIIGMNAVANGAAMVLKPWSARTAPPAVPAARRRTWSDASPSSP